MIFSKLTSMVTAKWRYISAQPAMQTWTFSEFARKFGLHESLCGRLSLSLTYAQEGEDMVLARIFENRARGFYVDVGAYQPARFSNTYYFYLRGWTGINIDATPGSMARFRAMRPLDTNIEAAVSDVPATLKFHLFNEPGLNTFDEALAKSRDGLRHYRMTGVKGIKTQTLAELLQRHMPPDTVIDFMSVDVEGFDLAVLRSNDWARFSPTYLLVEDLVENTISSTHESPLGSFLQPLGYQLFAKTVYTRIYQKRSPA